MRILIAGDYSPKIVSDKDYHGFVGIIKSFIRSIKDVDFSIVNFETTIPTPLSQKIIKCGPPLKSAPIMAKALHDAGFDAVTMANNHILDYGDDALSNTIKVIEENKLKHVGAGANLEEASKPLYVSHDGLTLAIVNCCEHEFSIATDISAGACPIDPILQYQQISTAKQHADVVIVITHGGPEYHQYPTPRMQRIYRHYIDLGADAVVNHHQHCFSGYENYKGKYIFYGLGNFIFPKINPNFSDSWHMGFCLIFDLKKSGIDFEIHPFAQSREVTIAALNEEEAKNFDSKIKEINTVISIPEALRNMTEKWMSDTEYSYKKLLTPYSNRYISGLWKYNLLPSFIKKSKVRYLLNYINCQSHRDRLLFLLNKIK